MKPLKMDDVVRVTGGRWVGGATGDLEFAAICTDTRAMKPRSLFIAIRGERFDAHDKLADAAAGGAIAAVVEERWATSHCSAPLPLISVDDTRLAMGRLAAHVRDGLRGKVIAVGGSNGKTSTKYLIQSILSKHLRGTFSPKSFNNDIGVPLAIFAADPEDQYLILEIGTNHPGEVRTLTRMCRPDIAVITSISPEHLEGLGDIDGVRREEASIIEGLKPNGTLIVNGDDAPLLDLIGDFAGRTITFGFGASNHLVAEDVRCDESGVRFALAGRGIRVPMLGHHVASNALAALAAAREMGLSDDAIIAALGVAHGPDMRLQVATVEGITLLNDAYNANPASTRSALQTLCAIPSSGRRVAVMGEMRELGEHAEQYHHEAGAFAGSCKLELLICVGRHAPLIASAARAAGMPREQVIECADVPSAAADVPRRLRRGDVVLFKASRGVELERVVKAVIEKKSAATEPA